MKNYIIPLLILAQTMAYGDSFKEVYAAHFPIGTAISYKEVVSADSAELASIKKNFSIITAENAFKWDAIHPEEDRYDFVQADRIADFARENGLKLWGHVLVWHYQTPDWIFEDGCKEASRELVLKRMRDHILTLMDRYRDVIYGWDVVNEAISDEEAVFLHESKWVKIVGKDFIEKAFSYAMEANTDALLSYNDYAMATPVKREKMKKLISGLLDKGLQVDTVGFQSHYSLYYPTMEELDKSICMVKNLGLKVSVSEIDLSAFHYQDKSDRYEKGLPEELELYQGFRYAELMDLYMRWSDSIERVTFWGIYDARNWKNYWPVQGRTDYAGLIARDGRKKAAYEAVLNPRGFLKKYAKLKRLQPPQD